LNELKDYADEDSDFDPTDVYLYDIRGDDLDFKKYLPWFLENHTRDGDFDFYTRLLFAKFGQANFAQWPEYERHPIENYLVVFWKSYLLGQSSDTGANDILYCFSFVFPDLQVFLDMWAHCCRFDSAPALRRIVQFGENIQSSREKKNPTEPISRLICQWLAKPMMQQILNDLVDVSQTEECSLLALQIQIELKYLAGLVEPKNSL
jgi:hypothetical protein